MKVIHVGKTLQKRNGWLSISRDYKKIIAQGKTLQQLIANLKRKSNPNGYIVHSPSQEITSYVG